MPAPGAERDCRADTEERRDEVGPMGQRQDIIESPGADAPGPAPLLPSGELVPGVRFGDGQELALLHEDGVKNPKQ